MQVQISNNSNVGSASGEWGLGLVPAPHLPYGMCFTRVLGVCAIATHTRRVEPWSGAGASAGPPAGTGTAGAMPGVDAAAADAKEAAAEDPGAVLLWQNKEFAHDIEVVLIRPADVGGADAPGGALHFAGFMIRQCKMSWLGCNHHSTCALAWLDKMTLLPTWDL